MAAPSRGVTALLVTALVLQAAAGRLAGAQQATAEPRNAAEVAAKKQAEETGINEKYQALVATLSPEEQAWERALQEHLGTFYLPIHKREKVTGRSNAWDFVRDDPALPRVLLIGDSVSRGYTQAVRKALAGRANVHRAPANCGPTASGIKNIDAWLASAPGGGKWDVIHFNFGIHDRNTPVADYVARLGQLVERSWTGDARLNHPANPPDGCERPGRAPGPRASVSAKRRGLPRLEVRRQSADRAGHASARARRGRLGLPQGQSRR